MSQKVLQSNEYFPNFPINIFSQRAKSIGSWDQLAEIEGDKHITQVQQQLPHQQPPTTQQSHSPRSVMRRSIDKETKQPTEFKRPRTPTTATTAPSPQTLKKTSSNEHRSEHSEKIPSSSQEKQRKPETITTDVMEIRHTLIKINESNDEHIKSTVKGRKSKHVTMESMVATDTEAQDETITTATRKRNHRTDSYQEYNLNYEYALIMVAFFIIIGMIYIWHQSGGLKV